MLKNAIANLTNILRMTLQNDKCMAYLQIHTACVSFFVICKPLSNQLAPGPTCSVLEKDISSSPTRKR